MTKAMAKPNMRTILIASRGRRTFFGGVRRSSFEHGIQSFKSVASSLIELWVWA
jgi:hypothetical protein